MSIHTTPPANPRATPRRLVGAHAAALALALLAVAGRPGPALAQAPTPDAADAQPPAHADDPEQPAPTPRTYRVESISLQFGDNADALARQADRVLAQAVVELVPTDDGYAAAAASDTPEADAGARPRPIGLALVDVGRLVPPELSPSAIRAVARAIVARYNELGFGGVRVDLAPDQIDPAGKDVRPDNQTALAFRVQALPITAVTSRAAGDRFDGDDPDNRPEHQHIRERSPVAGKARDGDAVLRTRAIQDYVAFLNRHPGRRVDAAVVAADAPDALALRYLVAEAKPWLLYAQASNTGTEQTANWREQFGFVHRQLTGNDDVLSAVYSTAGFDAVHALSGAYEAPLPNAPRWRYRINAAYSEFVASDIGFTDLDFTGQSHSVGGELSWNFLQRRNWFLDAFAGLTWQHIEVDNQVSAIEGTEQFLQPRLGLRSDRLTETERLFGSVELEWNADGLASTNDDDASRLGRDSVDAQWAILRFNLSAAFFLEPLLNPDAWADLSTPASSTLAHELAFTARGQTVLAEQRTIPQLQMTAGGLHSVRGYDESSAVGDNALILSAEYRFHLPRALAPNPEPGRLLGRPFRFAPPSPRGRPDWNLLLKAFVDYAHLGNNSPTLGEGDEDLLGAGVGAELQLMQYLTLRVEWAAALNDVEEQDAGENRVHLSATISY